MLGQREGETYLAFRKRLAAVTAARSLFTQAWFRFCGNRREVANYLGIKTGAMFIEMKRAGLTPAILHELSQGGGQPT